MNTILNDHFCPPPVFGAPGPYDPQGPYDPYTSGATTAYGTVYGYGPTEFDAVHTQPQYSWQMHNENHLSSIPMSLEMSQGVGGNMSATGQFWTGQHVHNNGVPRAGTIPTYVNYVQPTQFVSSPQTITAQTQGPGTGQGLSQSTHVQPMKPKRRRVATYAQRRAANIRERRRMFNLNEAFDLLRKKVPTFAYEKRLSRIETLRLAIIYISYMADIVEGVDPKEAQIRSLKQGWPNKNSKHLLLNEGLSSALREITEEVEDDLDFEEENNNDAFSTKKHFLDDDDDDDCDDDLEDELDVLAEITGPMMSSVPTSSKRKCLTEISCPVKTTV